MVCSAYRTVTVIAATAFAGVVAAALTDAGPQAPLTVDHYVRVRSSSPAILGQVSQIFVRERASSATVLPGATLGGRVVLFVHGVGTPAEVAFDVPSPGYSWM